MQREVRWFVHSSVSFSVTFFLPGRYFYLPFAFVRVSLSLSLLVIFLTVNYESN